MNYYEVLHSRLKMWPRPPPPASSIYYIEVTTVTEVAGQLIPELTRQLVAFFGHLVHSHVN